MLNVKRSLMKTSLTHYVVTNTRLAASANNYKTGQNTRENCLHISFSRRETHHICSCFMPVVSF